MAESFADMPEALASTLEIAERCDTTIALKQQLIPRFDTPNGESEEAYLRALVDAGPAQALRRPDPGPGPRARRPGARRHRQHGLQRVLPDRLGLRRLRQGERDRGRPGPRLGGRQHRLLLPRDHRRRPAPLRPAVRALPQRRARVDAGHRHRLLRPRPRPRDPLRDREVRRGPRRPDHHLRPHVPARRHARRRARPRPRLRRRRPPRQAHPRPDHGPPAELRGLPAAGRRARRRGREGPDRQADRRRRPRPRGDRPQRLDPRRRGRHLRPPADRHRPAPARRRRRGGGRREDLPHRHPVLDEADRGDRAAEDGLPRPAQPRRDRGRADDHRALDRPPASTWRRSRSTTRRPTR